MSASATDLELTPITSTGTADRRLVGTLREVDPIIRGLRPNVMVIGGLMVRLWLHARPIGLPLRPTADLDLGVDRRALRLFGDKRRVGPLLEEHGFEPGFGGEPFRFSKQIDGVGLAVVDVVVPPGSSRDTPPTVERGLETVAAPGLAYAVMRGPVIASGRFVDRDNCIDFELPIPTVDAAFVLKAALVASGVRMRPDRVRTDSVDAIALAAACLECPDGVLALRENARRSDVRKSVAWIRESFRSPTARGSRRVEDYFEAEGYGSGTGDWAHRTAQALADVLS